jgi:hypothetical protein
MFGTNYPGCDELRSTGDDKEPVRNSRINVQGFQYILEEFPSNRDLFTAQHGCRMID